MINIHWIQSQNISPTYNKIDGDGEYRQYTLETYMNVIISYDMKKSGNTLEWMNEWISKRVPGNNKNIIKCTRKEPLTHFKQIKHIKFYIYK